MKIAIIGADGQLGSEIVSVLSGCDTASLTEREIDVTQKKIVRKVLSSIRPELVINTAAFTDVDRCEKETSTAFQVNALGARYVAETCESMDTTLLHISTDYVFDGKKTEPYTENDPPGPLNVYGVSKLAGEILICNSCSRYYIVRTSGLYGLHRCIGKGRNFVDTMLKLAGEKDVLKVVSDEILTPTFTEDLAAQIKLVIEKTPPFGIYHATNEGECSWYEFAGEIFRLSGMSVCLEETTSAEWNAPATRPLYSVLENAALNESSSCIMPHWKDALERYLQKKGIRKQA